ncbi:CinA family protein [Denitratisoma oestradiolicum]|uniref:CinA C-terminal domain-containing protein n=1 Tax=Denitratisoma oestradiolicum TaxID=311182 RepID=A0A6S6Y5W7_9PROT|nr:nicotinamide-nucleotide amidohydrolase family protein [Denitratisoma oestradiolicum]TWO80745.1 damage-inducible protein CinA [Denitratisoma oestradiolicum]CAB1370947.1 conserved hypothetical protein [Denitratisoma oestradiolicum]
MDALLAELSARVGAALKAGGLTLVTAESCTGGWVAQVITHTAGSSDWFEGGFVTYSNNTKERQLGVRPDTLARAGAVSLETVAEMAQGALANSNAMISLAITGIAGPGGGSPDKPVGTVCFAWCWRGEAPLTQRCCFGGDREAVRYQSVTHGLEQLLAQLEGSRPARTVP